MALTDNLISYYKLDESSGNAADAHGSNTLTNNNTATFAAGKINNGASLASASSQYFDGTVDLGTTPAAVSLSAWINRSNAGTEKMNIGWGTDLDRIFIQVWTDGNVYLPVENGSSSYWNAADGLTGWHHYILVYDGTLAAGSRVKLYRDGSGVALTQGGADPPTTYGGTTTFEIGRYNTDNYANGMFDEVGIWDRALTSGEAATLYGAGSGLAYPFSAPAATRTSNLSLLGVG